MPWVPATATTAGVCSCSSAVATGCWTYCIYQVGAVSRQRTWALVSGGAAATLTLTGGVSSWDAVILSESLSLSMVALYLGGILSLSRGGRYGAPTAWLTASTAALLLVLIRPVLLPLIFVPGLVPLSAWVRSNRQRDRTVKRRASLIAVGALLALRHRTWLPASNPCRSVSVLADTAVQLQAEPVVGEVAKSEGCGSSEVTLVRRQDRVVGSG